VAYVPLCLINIFEKIQYCVKNFKNTTLPGVLVLQYFVERFEKKQYWPGETPPIWRCTNKDPQGYLQKDNSFVLLRKIDKTTKIFKLHLTNKTGILEVLNRTPFEKTVTPPRLFLPEWF